jgi:hypothetical protein
MTAPEALGLLGAVAALLVVRVALRCRELLLTPVVRPAWVGREVVTVLRGPDDIGDLSRPKADGVDPGAQGAHVGHEPGGQGDRAISPGRPGDVLGGR